MNRPSASPSLQIDRRSLLRTSGIAAGTAALISTPALIHASDAQSEELVFDVALDGGTFRMIRANATDPNALPMLGDTFVMYGTIFPSGTFDQGRTGPNAPGAIGRWICRGSFNVDLASGAVPHAISTVVHILGDGLSVSRGAVEEASDAIVHEGLESGVPVIRRSVLGGYGKYAGVRGEAVQEYQGDNETVIQITPEVTMPAPNYTFTFTLTS